MQPHYFMASRRGKGGSSDRLPLLGLQNHCGWWLQPWSQMFASWWENCGKPRQCVEKQRHDSAAKGPPSQGYGLPSHQYHCESWTVKKVDAFELWRWRRLLRVPWLARKPNQSILREINLEYSLEGLMLKLKLQYWSSDANSWLIGKVSDAGKDRGQDKRASEDEMSRRHHQCNGHKLEQTSGDGERQGGLICCSPWGSQRVGRDWVTEQQQLQGSSRPRDGTHISCIFCIDRKILYHCLTREALRLSVSEMK